MSRLNQCFVRSKTKIKNKFSNFKACSSKQWAVLGNLGSSSSSQIFILTLKGLTPYIVHEPGEAVALVCKVMLLLLRAILSSRILFAST